MITNASLTEFIKDNQKLIYSIIGKYKGLYDMDDLYQVALYGLCKYASNYNPNLGIKFTTYAYKCMLGEVLNYVCTNRIVKVNKEVISLNKKIENARLILSQRLMKEPSIRELALFLEIDESVISNVIFYNQSIDSLDRIIKEDGKTLTVLDTVKDSKDSCSVDDIMLKEEISKLSDFERQIIYGRYFEDKTQAEISSELGVNQVYVSRSEKKILKKMKNNMTYSNAA